MPTPYPVASGNNTANLYELFRFANDGVGGTFMPVMLAVIWIIAFIGSISEGRQASRAFIFASFVGSILAMILVILGMLNIQYMYLLFLGVGVGVIWNVLSNAAS